MRKPHHSILVLRVLIVLSCLAAMTSAAEPVIRPDQPNIIAFAPQEARFVQLFIRRSSGGQPCIDEFEVRATEDGDNLAAATNGGKATASSCLPGYPIHQIEHLNDGLYGNSHSWIAAGTTGEWARIELPKTMTVGQVVFSRDRDGRYHDRTPVAVEVLLSTDGVQWNRVAVIQSAEDIEAEMLRSAWDEGDPVRYAFLAERLSCHRIDDATPTARVLGQMRLMLDRFAAKGLDVSTERETHGLLEARFEAMVSETSADASAELALFLEARIAKRRLFFREPDLATIERLLFVERHPFVPSHNYSVKFDARGGPGGAVCVLETPWRQGRLRTEEATVTRLFESGEGIARDPVAGFDAQRIYFSHRATTSGYFHLFSMNIDGSGVKQLTDGPFHDDFPCPLPDGGLAFVSTRCKARFLCWRPQAFVLFRMDSDGDNIRPLSHANVSEWTPGMMRDGRILWMRSEYLDKGANFGHTLWAVRPDGTHPEMIFGNNTRNCYAHGRQVPGTDEICCTLVSHGGDLNGPIALIDTTRGRSNPESITNITPDSPPHYHMDWARRQCFRDPLPVSGDYFLCSHAPEDHFGLYVIDRYGNRELLHFDPSISSFRPSPLRPTTRPPVIGSPERTPRKTDTPEPALGQFVVADMHKGLGPSVPRGRVKYLRVCAEARSDLLRLPNGEYQADHAPFQDWYATPIHLVNGPFGWPSYVAKETFGLATVETDGSANFFAPSGKVLYFQALDEDFNELQRMRSVVQLQPGERRGCVGCHENRMSAPPRSRQAGNLAMRRPPEHLQPPPWGVGPFAYERTVQPVWDAKCVSCHDARDEQHIDLTGELDRHRVPASYRTLIAGGWVHHFDCRYPVEHTKAPAGTFGTLRSKLWTVLDAGHHDVHLTEEQTRAVKCWIDMNCPLWPDYQFRPERCR